MRPDSVPEKLFQPKSYIFFLFFWKQIITLHEQCIWPLRKACFLLSSIWYLPEKCVGLFMALLKNEINYMMGSYRYKTVPV